MGFLLARGLGVFHKLAPFHLPTPTISSLFSCPLHLLSPPSPLLPPLPFSPPLPLSPPLPHPPQVYTLPGLELATDCPLSHCCGWRWEWEAAALPRLPHTTACTRHGHLALLGPNRELLRLALAERAAPLLPAETVFDWDLAAAAHAAGMAHEQARAARALATQRGGAQQQQRRPGAEAGPGAGGDDGEAGAAVAGREAAGDGQQEGAVGGRPKDIKALFARIGQDFQKAGGQVAMGFQKAFDETHKGLQKVAQVGGASGDVLGGGVVIIRQDSSMS